MQIKLIFTTKVSHLASFWKWEFLELRNGLFWSLIVSPQPYPAQQKQHYFPRPPPPPSRQQGCTLIARGEICLSVVKRARACYLRSSVFCQCFCRHRPVDMAKFVLLVCLFLQFVSSVASEDKCIAGLYHKSSPSPETNDFKACHAFKDSSCCTAAFTVELVANETRNLYNHSWHRCGQLSEKCQEFWVKQVSVFVSCWFKVFRSFKSEFLILFIKTGRGRINPRREFYQSNHPFMT